VPARLRPGCHLIREDGDERMDEGPEEIGSRNEMDIRSPIERQASAVREKNIAGIGSDHDSEMLI
jgi:hypothetical protein